MQVMVKLTCGSENPVDVWVESKALPDGPPDMKQLAKDYKRDILFALSLLDLPQHVAIGSWSHKPGELICDRVVIAGRKA